MNNSQGSSNILQVIDNYDIIIYDVENVNPNKKLLVLDSNKGKVLIQRYFGTSKQLWLAYNVFKTLRGNDVLRISDWYITADGAPFIEADKKLYYCTKYYDTKLTAEVALIDHMSFLAKWHYLSREIVYARDFADSLTTPRNLDKQINEKRLEGNADKLRKRIIHNLQQLNLYEYSEKKLTVTLPMFNIKRLVRKDDDCLFQPWQQIFDWNWQLADIANILCFFKFDKKENIKESLYKYHKLNPLSESEWKALPSLMLWNLCKEVNYELVSDSYFDFYELLCTLVEERGIIIEDKITLPLTTMLEETIIEDTQPKITEENVNIVVVNPKETAPNTPNIDNDTSNKVVQFANLEVNNQQQELHKKETPIIDTGMNKLVENEVEISQEVQEVNEEKTNENITLEDENIIEVEETNDEETKADVKTNDDVKDIVVEEIKVEEDIIIEEDVITEDIKVKLETLNWKPFPESPFNQ